MSHLTSVQFEINEFQTIMKTIDSKISLIYETVKESITDMSNGVYDSFTLVIYLCLYNILFWF